MVGHHNMGHHNKCQHKRLELFFTKKQMYPPFRNQTNYKIAFSCYKGNNLKNKHARVMVLVHETSSECALQMYEVSLKYL